MGAGDVEHVEKTRHPRLALCVAAVEENPTNKMTRSRADVQEKPAENTNIWLDLGLFIDFEEKPAEQQKTSMNRLFKRNPSGGNNNSSTCPCVVG